MNNIPSALKSLSPTSLTSPKRPVKREEGWKEVVRPRPVNLIRRTQGFKFRLIFNKLEEEKSQSSDRSSGTLSVIQSSERSKKCRRSGSKTPPDTSEARCASAAAWRAREENAGMRVKNVKQSGLPPTSLASALHEAMIPSSVASIITLGSRPCPLTLPPRIGTLSLGSPDSDSAFGSYLRSETCRSIPAVGQSPDSHVMLSISMLLRWLQVGQISRRHGRDLQQRQVGLTAIATQRRSQFGMDLYVPKFLPESLEPSAGPMGSGDEYSAIIGVGRALKSNAPGSATSGEVVTMDYSGKAIHH
ncbi:hypothetical protein OUZ56_023507 [Daphnia magna]|uniref:Uncharacterized protein n=1 Tax=Daphnia magna TaxID=35525 RepID=A0ABR0AZ69_9CRUS|nr:hypothetical protein OUZ56_023507 [Daphnia magna]